MHGAILRFIAQNYATYCSNDFAKKINLSVLSNGWKTIYCPRSPANGTGPKAGG